MGKYASSARKRVKAKSDGPHAIWRGIGCIMMLIIPAISISAGIQTVNYGLENKWTFPFQLMGFIEFPDYFYKSNGLMTVLGPLTRIQHLLAYVAVCLLYMVVIGGVISMLYAFVYNMVGPARYGPTDAPPPKIRTKKYTR